MPKYSDEANRLWPYLLPKIEKVRSTTIINNTSGGSGGGAVVPGDTTTFLLRDGTRSLTGNWAVDSGVTIDGVDISAHAADPDAHHSRATAGDGITLNVGTQVVAVNEAFNFDWTGTHTFNVDVQVNADLDFIGGDRLITASDDLTLQPDDDLWLNPGGLIMLPDDQELRSATIADLPTGINGVRLWERSDAVNYWQLTMGAAKFDELYARVFVADEVRIDRGEEYWSKSYGIVETDFDLPALGATVDVWFEDAPALLGADLFSAGDYLLLRAIDWGTGLLIIKCWFTADSKLANDTTNDRQQWRLTRKKFGTTGVKIKKGNVVLDAGQVGQGWLHLSALSQDGGPFFQVGDFTAVVDDEPIFTPRTRMGNLNGTVDYATTAWGFVTGDNLGVEPDAGFSGLTSDATNGLRLFNTDLSLYEAGNIATTLHRTHGLAFLNDSALFASDLRTISWYDDLDDVGSAFATARMSAWGGSSDRRTEITSFSLDLASVFLSASGDGGSNVASLSVKAGGWHGVGTGIVDMAATDVRVIGGGANFVVGGGTSKFADSVIHAYEDSANTGSSAGITVEQDGGGDALLHWSLSLGQAFTAGIDNSDGDKWKVSAGMSLGTTDFITVDATAGTVTIVGLTGGSVSSGLIGGDGIDLAGETISVDATVVRTTRNVSSGDGLQGGGNLSADRTLAVDATVVRTTRTVDSGAGLTGGGALSTNLTLAVGAGDGISVAADSVAVDATVVRTTRTLTAGAGLSGGGDLSADRTFTVGAGNGISVATDTVAVSLAANPGLTFSGGALLMGTPASLGVTSSNAIVGTAHSHTVVTSADVSAGTQAILASSGAGGLGLASLFTTGAVDVGQSLNAGNDAFRVIYHTHDADHAHVVINPSGGWTLDEQFGLDIDDNLLVRGWIVGKHAIQLDGATMLLHYDGPERVGDLSGQTRGHLGQVPVVETGVTFAPGKFGKAVQVPPAITNYVSNPSFEVDMTNWTNFSTGTATGTRGRVTEEAYAGSYSYKIVKTGGATADRYGTQGTVTIFSSTTYTVSAWVNIPATAGGAQSFSLSVGGTISGIDTIVGPTDGWVRLSVTAAGTAGSVFVTLITENCTTMTAYVDAVQIEAASTPTAYADGTLGSGHAWVGTAHASPSTRSSAQLDYNASGVLNQRAGTVMAWIYPTDNNIDQMVFSHFSGGDEVFIRALSTGFWEYAFSSSVQATTGNVTVDAWQHVALTWEVGAVTFYLNGTAISTLAAGAWDVLAATFSIGYYPAFTNQHWFGLIDDVVILGRAATADEVRAVYESNAPVFAETSTWQWRAGRNRIYADAEGLWGLGASGGTILGLYAGDEEDPAATKSWGGLSLSEGDFLLGQYGASKGGWMFFDQDLVGGLPAWVFGWGTAEVLRLDSSGASLTGVLDIDTSGGIYQGTGTFASPTTGLKIWNASGVGIIGGYKAGVSQWLSNTDGQLSAGAGNVLLDANGVTIAAKTVLALENTPLTHSVLWQRSGNIIGAISTQYWSSANDNWMVLGPVSEASGRDANLLLQTIPFGGGTGANISLLSTGAISVSGTTTFANAATFSSTVAISGTATTNSIVTSGQIAATLNDATVAPLYLSNSTGPYMYFNNGMSGAALGAYQGKIPVRIGATIYYIGIYA